MSKGLTKEKKELLVTLKQISTLVHKVVDMDLESEHILNVLSKETMDLYPFGISMDDFGYALDEYINALEDEIKNEVD